MNCTLENAEKLYTYAYPLVMMEITHAGDKNDDEFHHRRVFPDASDKKIVKLNNDTLYSEGYTQLKNTPYVLELPEKDITERYLLIQIMNAYTQVIGSIGTRTRAVDAKKYIFVYKNNDVPEGFEDYRVVRCDTSVNMFFMRIETRGKYDYKFVNDIQDSIIFRPVYPQKVEKTMTVEEIIGKAAPENKEYIPPVVRINSLSAQDFYKIFTYSIRNNPIDDEEIKEIFETFGYDGETGNFDYSNLDTEKKKLLEDAVISAFNQFKNHDGNGRVCNNNWSYAISGLGDYGKDYKARASVAFGGFGANIPQDSVYPATYTDMQGNQLVSEKKYIIHFAADGFPHASIFWSLTLYGEPSQFLAENKIDRYMINSFNMDENLFMNEDGSLDIYICRQEPTDEKERKNWLPAPANEDKFMLALRVYYPDEMTLQGKWAGPDIIVVNE